MIDKARKKSFGLLYFLTALISFWFLINNLNPQKTIVYSYLIFSASALILFISLFFQKKINKIVKIMDNLLNKRGFSIVIILLIASLGILLRLLFFYNFQYDPVSDPITFFQSGQNIANDTGIMGNSYPAFFPFLSGYNNLLGIAMNVIANPWLATILLNTTFDILSGILAFFVIRRVHKGSIKPAFFATGLWILSPINIVFSVISLPVVMVNFFIMLSFLFSSWFLEKSKTIKIKKELLYAILLGAAFGIGTAFRPIFIILIIALVLTQMLTINKFNKNSLVRPVFSLSVIILVFGFFQLLNLKLIETQTGIKPATKASGWTTFVGANIVSSGKWNHEDEVIMHSMCPDLNSDINGCHQRLQEAGIDRYKSYGIVTTAQLFMKKIYIFSSNQSSLYNAEGSIVGYSKSNTKKAIDSLTGIYLISLFTLAFLALFSISRKSLYTDKVSKTLLFIAIATLGLFFSIIFVETSERYAQILYPGFTIFAATAYTRKKQSIKAR